MEGGDDADTGSCVQVEGLNFSWGHGGKEVLHDLSFTLPSGSRLLLVGSNGTGKTTLLRILAGKHWHEPGVVSVLGRSAFFDTPEDKITYLGTEWRHNDVTKSDVDILRLLNAAGGDQYPERRDELVQVLGVDLTWRMHQVSDGQRKRVQIAMGLIRPFHLLLLDEVTVDLDVLVRADLMQYLMQQSNGRGASIVYATHIFDGMGGWPTHVLHLGNGRVSTFAPLPTLPAYVALRAKPTEDSPLLRLVQQWLRQERAEREASGGRERAEKAPEVDQPSAEQQLARTTDRFYNYWG